MKATGIVRRIDDLGRVVIPKEIRRTMRIREGDPLEIYTDREGEVIFKKYSPIGELNAFAEQYADTLHKTCLMSVAICDRDGVIACAGVPKKEYYDKRLSSDMEPLFDSRTLYRFQTGARRIHVTEDATSYYTICAMPIVNNGDILGCVAALAPSQPEREPDDAEVKLTQTAAVFLSRQFSE